MRHPHRSKTSNSIPDLGESGLGTALAALGWEEPPVRNLLARIRSLLMWMPELSWTGWDEDLLQADLPQFCLGCRSFDELRKRSVAEWLLGRLVYAERQILDRKSPEKYGPQVEVRSPCSTPKDARRDPGSPDSGTVRMGGDAHRPGANPGPAPLLALNYRPQQVTDDLRSFWNNTYQQVRKELRHVIHGMPRRGSLDGGPAAAPQTRCLTFKISGSIPGKTIRCQQFSRGSTGKGSVSRITWQIPEFHHNFRAESVFPLGIIPGNPVIDGVSVYVCQASVDRQFSVVVETLDCVSTAVGHLPSSPVRGGGLSGGDRCQQAG